MSGRIVFALFVLSSFVLLAADQIQRLDVKAGLWEVTSSTNSSGRPPIPPDVLAKMTPEQRARFDEAMKRRAEATSGKKIARKECVTKEKLDKQYMFEDERKECTRTILSSTSRKLDAKIHCSGGEGMSSDGTFHIESPNSENVTGKIEMVASGGDNNMKINSEFTAHYVGPNCGDVK